MLDWIIDARAPWPPITDQGQRPTCLAVALTTSHEHAADQEVSAEYLHWASGKYPGGRGNPDAAGAALARRGQPPSSQWPYRHETDDSCADYMPPTTVVGPFARRRCNRLLSNVDEARIRPHARRGAAGRS